MSIMSAPCAAMSRACAMAIAGFTNWPPSENESGVTLRMPMTSGRPCASNAESWRGAAQRAPSAEEAIGAAIPMRADLRGPGNAVKRAWAASRGQQETSICNLERQLPGVVDPAHDVLLRRQQADKLALSVGLRHRLGEVAWIAVLQFLHGIDARCLQQFGIFLAHAFDAHAVGHVGPAEQTLFVDTGLGGQHLASFDRPRMF